MESGPKWQIHSDFPSCSESAEIAMPTLFPWKNVAVFFSTSGETRLQTCFWKFPPPYLPSSPLPPPPPSSNSGHTHAQCFGSQGSKFYIVWRRTEREGGAILSIFFCLLEKKNLGIFLTQTESTWQISADSEQLGKLLQNCHLGLAFLDPFNCQSHLGQHTIKYY